MLSGEKFPENAWQPGAATVPFPVDGIINWKDVEAARKAASQGNDPPYRFRRAPAGSSP